MGAIFSNQKKEKSEEEILNDISELNKITNNELFYKRTSYKINFQKSENFFSNFSGKIIQCNMETISQGKSFNKREKNINLQKFYNISNAIMNCLHLFYKDKIEIKLIKESEKINDLKTENIDINEETNCPICEEKKVTMMINCYVS